MDKLTAKDTVLKKNKVNRILKQKGSYIPYWVIYNENHPDYKMCLAQAEETERLLKDQWIKEGRREVVGWLNKNCACFNPNGDGIYIIQSWKQQLQEWGIDK